MEEKNVFDYQGEKKNDSNIFGMMQMRTENVKFELG